MACMVQIRTGRHSSSNSQPWFQDLCSHQDRKGNAKWIEAIITCQVVTYCYYRQYCST
jgi:hypothetical protein